MNDSSINFLVFAETEQMPGSFEDGQQRLIQLMNQFKAGELTMDEVNILFQEWKINNVRVFRSVCCSILPAMTHSPIT